MADETRTGQGGPDQEPATAGWVDPSADAPTGPAPPASTPGPGRVDRSTGTLTTHEQPDAPARPIPQPEHPEIPGYRLLAVVGRGGMGTVYRAVHRELNRVVALKLINPGGRDEEALRVRFEREVRALSRIDHPNIVP